MPTKQKSSLINSKMDYEHIEQEYATIGKVSGVEVENDDAEQPFDAEKISISTIFVPLQRLIDRLKKRTIIASEIQRNDNLWDIQKKSRLIESLMLKIPLPMFYVAADVDENWNIVDGLQRISVIKQYLIENKLKLQGLEFLIDFEGKEFTDLPDRYQNRIMDTQFQFAVIGSTTPPEVQRNIFRRLNTGGLPLTAQEIRHALYYSKSTNDFLLRLINAKEFIEATTDSTNDTRMATRELILRFVAFLLRDTNAYKNSKDMDSFLSDTMQLMNSMPEMSDKKLRKFFYNRKDVIIECKYKDFDVIYDKFILAMSRSRAIFGEQAFRKILDIKKRAPINKSIFECVAVILTEINEEDYKYLVTKKDDIVKYMSREFSENTTIERIISRDSQNVKSVEKRFQWFREILVYKDFGEDKKFGDKND